MIASLENIHKLGGKVGGFFQTQVRYQKYKKLKMAELLSFLYQI